MLDVIFFFLMILVPLGFFFVLYNNGYMFFCLVWVFDVYCVMVVNKVSLILQRFHYYC